MSANGHDQPIAATSKVYDTTIDVVHMFPRLGAAQIARLETVGNERRLAAGEVLWDVGAMNMPFYVVVDGGVAIEAGPDGEVVVVHEAGGFTGDVDMLSGRPAAVRARADRDTTVLEVQREHFRALVQTDAELGEIVLRAFILRRLALIESGLGSVVFVGSRRSADTLNLQEFLTRNGRPYAYVDVDSDPSVRDLLDHFKVGPDDVPVLICWSARRTCSRRACRACSRSGTCGRAA